MARRRSKKKSNGGIFIFRCASCFAVLGYSLDCVMVFMALFTFWGLATSFVRCNHLIKRGNEGDQRAELGLSLLEYKDGSLFVSD